MRVIYWRVTLLAVLFLGSLGTWALVRPMGALPIPSRGWIAWGVVLCRLGKRVVGQCASPPTCRGSTRWRCSDDGRRSRRCGAILTSFVVLLMGGRLLALVVANQAWAIVNVFRNWQLSRVVEGGRFRTFRHRGLDPEVFSVAWPPAWRSGLGISFSRGVLYASGLIYAQVARAAALSTYLLAFRAIQMVNELAQAPFSSKIPVLARLRSEGRFAEQLALARRAMQLDLLDLCRRLRDHRTGRIWRYLTR